MRTWFSGHGGGGLIVGLDDLKGLFQPKRFYDSKFQVQITFKIKESLQFPVLAGMAPQT